MSFDLATAYTRSGLTASAANNLVLNGELDVTLAMVEQYLDRLLLFRRENVQVIHLHANTIQVSRYPIAQVVSVQNANIATISTATAVGNVGTYLVHNAVGMIVFDEWTATGRDVRVTYDGGYKVFPADLEWALWQTFDAVRAAAAGGATVAAGTIESVSITGVGTVRYASGAASAAAVASPGGGGSSLIPATAFGVLDHYRLKAA